MATIIQTTIPKAQKEIIKQSLINLEAQIKSIEKLNSQNSEFNFLLHDLHVLKSLFNYEIIIQISPEERKNFVFMEGVDYPEWTK